MKWVPAGLHGIALLLALNVQFLESPVAGAWLLFHLAGCAALLATNEPFPKKTALWWALFAWLTTLELETFIIRPVTNGAFTMWILSAMPMLALCMKQSHLNRYFAVFMGVLLVYASSIVIQMVLDVHYTRMDYGGVLGHTAMAWPLVDPNNAAAVLNTGLLPCVWLCLRRNGWLCPAAVFALALFFTGSKAGMIVGLVGTVLITMNWLWLRLSALAWILAYALLILFIVPDSWLLAVGSSLDSRTPLWLGSIPLLGINPLTGVGLGNFAQYYHRIQQETITAGMYAHNDPLQFAIELGIPAAAAFMALVALVADALPAIGAFVFMAVFLQSLVEFQFYLPAIAILTGLALARTLWELDPVASEYLRWAAEGGTDD